MFPSFAAPNSKTTLMKPSRFWIGRLFWTGAALTFVALLACAISLVLQAVGDRPGASGVWGVFLVAASAWLINFVSLVALLAWRAISEDDPDKPRLPPR
jgi:hypothetical protein